MSHKKARKLRELFSNYESYIKNTSRTRFLLFYTLMVPGELPPGDTQGMARNVEKGGRDKTKLILYNLRKKKQPKGRKR